MYKVMYREDVRYVSNRDGVYYYTRRVPYDVRQHYASHRLSFSLKTNSNSAGAALNKWLKQVAGSDYVIHLFRHSMRDRLTAVNCPSDMIDQIGFWSKKSIGEGYEEGFQIKQIQQMMKLLFY